MKRLSPGWAVGLLALIALALRLYRLEEGLWLDEIYTWVRFMGLPLHVIPTVYGSENQHFLFSLLAKLSLMIFGNSVWAFRLPAVLLGVASIVAVYLFGKEVASEKEGLLSAALLTFSYHHIWFSQNARGYTGLLFWTMMTSWLLLRAMRERRNALWIAYAVSAALGVYTQATIAFVLIAHAVIAARDAWSRREWRGPALGMGLGALLALLLHLPALPEILHGLKATNSVVAEWKNPVWTVTELAAGLRVGFLGSIAALAASGLFLAGAVSFLKARPTVVALLVFPPAVGVTCLLALGHHIWPRFFFFSFGFAALIAIRGALLFGKAGMPLAVAMIALSAASVPFAYGPKQDYNSAYRFIREHRLAGDAVATAGLTSWVYGRYYNAGFTSVESVAELEVLRQQATRTWLIYTLEPVFRSEFPGLYAAVQRDFKVAGNFPGTLNNGSVVVCLYGSGGGL